MCLAVARMAELGSSRVRRSWCAVWMIWTAVASVVILMIARAIGGLRVDEQTEVDGLDLAEHGERGYPGS